MRVGEGRSRPVISAIVIVLLQGLISTHQSSAGPANSSVITQQKINSTAAGQTTNPVQQQYLYIKDRTPANITTAQIKAFENSVDEDNSVSSRPGQGKFDDKAVQRALVVIAGIAVIVVAYLGIKFFLIKKRKVVKRYGRVEASEMDLLDEIDDDDESDGEEELFDINQQRRS